MQVVRIGKWPAPAAVVTGSALAGWVVPAESAMSTLPLMVSALSVVVPE